MPIPPVSSTPGCPSWCAGHDDEQEPIPPRWHRSDGVGPIEEGSRFFALTLESAVQLHVTVGAILARSQVDK